MKVVYYLFTNHVTNVQTFVFKRPAVFPRSLIVSMLFMSFYTIGLALFKVNIFIFLGHIFVSQHQDFGPLM